MQSYQAFLTFACLQLSSHPSTCLSDPKWVGHGQCAIVRYHSRRRGRAMQQPEHLLIAHCSKASSLKRINFSPPMHCSHLSYRSASETSCESKHVGSHAEARKAWQESGGSPGTTLSLLACSLSRLLGGTERDL